jgi:hypothetical protein
MENKKSKIAESLEKSGRNEYLFGRTITLIVGLGLTAYSICFTYMIIDVFIIASKGNIKHVESIIGMGIINLIMYVVGVCLVFINPSKHN